MVFADKSIRSDIFVVKENLESLLSGKTAETLGIISFNTINAVTEQQDSNNIHDTDSKIDEIVKKYPQVFEGIGKCKNRTIQLHLKDDVRPIIQPMRPIPYHLKKMFDHTVDEMVQEGILEVHSGPTEWLSNPVIVPRMTIVFVSR